MPADPRSVRNDDGGLREAAANWVVRRDRGFSDRDAAEFESWLAADSRHRPAFEKAQTAWRMLGEVPARVAQPMLESAAPADRNAWRIAGWGGLAAALALVLFIRPGEPTLAPVAREAARAPSSVAPAVAPDAKLLPDGTVVRLNTGAELVEEFSASERRIRLRRGEAYFTVTKDPARPFIVEAHGVQVRAVGTAFNVHLQSGAVAVLVTEGSVAVNPTPEAPEPAGVTPDAPGAQRGSEQLPADQEAMVLAGERAIVALDSANAGPRVVISKVDPNAVAQALAWRERLLKLGGATLAELVVEFERQTGRRIVLTDPRLGGLRVGGRFQRDDIEGFVRVLEKIHGVTSTRDADGTLWLGPRLE
jgi:transmembrane sensor